MLQQLQQRLVDEQNYTKDLIQKMKVRDDEILRLHDLYTPA